MLVKLPIVQNIENKIKLTFHLHSPISIDNFESEVILLVQDIDYRSDVGSLTLELMSELDKLNCKCFLIKVKYVTLSVNKM